MQKITLLYFGVTGTGKTTALAQLTSIPTTLLKLHRCRTRTTVQYHITPEAADDIVVEQLEASNDAFDNEVTWGRACEVAPPLRKLLTEDRATLLSDAIGVLPGKVLDIDIFTELLGTKELDSVIKRINVRVPAHAQLSEYLREKDVELYIRDSRGLLDQSANGLQAVTDTDASTLGLERADGVLFFTDKAQLTTVLNSAYSKLLKTVLNAVPIFFASRVDNLTVEPLALDGVRAVQHAYQEPRSRKNAALTGIQGGTLTLLQELEFIIASSTHEYAFTNKVFKLPKAQFVLPECCELNLPQTIGEWDSSPDLHTSALFNVAMSENIIGQILDLRKRMSVFVEDFRNDSWGQWCVSNDLADAWTHYPGNTSNIGSIFPKYECYTSAAIESRLEDPVAAHLGDRYGITTKDGSTPRHPETLLLAATSYSQIARIIQEAVPSESSEELQDLLRLFLRYIHYTKCLDYYASPNGYPITERHSVVAAIAAALKMPHESVFLKSIELIINNFREELRALDVNTLNGTLYKL